MHTELNLISGKNRKSVLFASSDADKYRYKAKLPLRHILPCTHECGLGDSARIDTSLILCEILNSLGEYGFPATAIIPLTMLMVTDYGRGTSNSGGQRTDDTDVAIVSDAPDIIAQGICLHQSTKAIPKFLKRRFNTDVVTSVWPEIPNIVRLNASQPYLYGEKTPFKSIVEWHCANTIEQTINTYAPFYSTQNGLIALVVNTRKIGEANIADYYPSTDLLSPAFAVKQTIKELVPSTKKEFSVRLTYQGFHERLIALGSRMAVLATLGSQDLSHQLTIDSESLDLIKRATQKWGDKWKRHIKVKVANGAAKIETTQRWLNYETELYERSKDKFPELLPPKFPFPFSKTCLQDRYNEIITQMGYSH